MSKFRAPIRKHSSCELAIQRVGRCDSCRAEVQFTLYLAQDFVGYVAFVPQTQGGLPFDPKSLRERSR